MGLKSHRTIPTLTDTLKECFVPCCGISITESLIWTISSFTPLTSFPKTRAIFWFLSNEKSFKWVELSACSTLAILYPASFKVLMESILFSVYIHSTDSVAPNAVLRISFFGGIGQIPQSIIFSIRKASEVLKTEPTLCALLTLSRTITIGTFFCF